LCWLVGSILLATPAAAATVVLVRTSRPDAIGSEATVRLRGELVADGFDVRVVDAAPAGDLRAALERAAAAPDVEAVVAIFAAPAADAAELWVIDRVTGKTVIRRVPNEPASDHAAEVLSIRALELLRASFLEVALAAGSHAAPAPLAGGVSPPMATPPPEVARFTQAALDNRWPKLWAVEVGGAVLGSFEGLPPSLVPVARVDRALGQRLIGRLMLAGLGTRARLDTAAGSASVTHELGLLELALRFRAGRRVQPLISVGAGALHVSSDGQATWPAQGKSGALWSAIADAGAGARIALRGRFELAFELHAQIARPYPVIQFLGTDVSREGRPTVIGGVTLVAWL
jgi:hypothetical protein